MPSWKAKTTELSAMTMWNGSEMMPTTLCASSHMRLRFLPTRSAKKSLTSDGSSTMTPDTSAIAYSDATTPMNQRLGSLSAGRPTTRWSTSMKAASPLGRVSSTCTAPSASRRAR
ncbi:hypothetical protein D3C72_2184880 [compost metagenome]